MNQLLADAMLMRKIIALREGMQKGRLNPLWVEQMLQFVSDDDHAGDFALRPVFATLRKPDEKQIEKIFAKGRGRGHQIGFEEKLYEFLGKINWLAGPDEVDVTIVTKANLFIDKNKEVSEQEIIDRAYELGLVWCPDWVVPALAYYAEDHASDVVSASFQFNLCLAFDDEIKWAFAMMYKRKWHFYRRSYGSTWADETKWLFVKP